MRPEDTQMASGRVEQPSLVERLRQPWPPSHSEDPLMTEAADEITRLAARVAELEAALRDIAKVTRGWEPGVWSEEEGRKYFAALFFRAQDKARAALTQPAENGGE
jgi:hypothetical protein